MGGEGRPSINIMCQLQYKSLFEKDNKISLKLYHTELMFVLQRGQRSATSSPNKYRRCKGTSKCKMGQSANSDPGRILLVMELRSVIE